jgi:TPR repeat protein
MDLYYPGLEDEPVVRAAWWAVVSLMILISVAVTQNHTAAASGHDVRPPDQVVDVMRLADEGNAGAQTFAGIFNEVVVNDYVEAIRWYHAAAEQGHAEAQFYLGMMYAAGRGVVRDDVAAYMWFGISSTHGNEHGRAQQDQMAVDLTKETIAEAQRRALVCLESQYQNCR